MAFAQRPIAHMLAYTKSYILHRIFQPDPQRPTELYIVRLLLREPLPRPRNEVLHPCVSRRYFSGMVRDEITQKMNVPVRRDVHPGA